MRRFAACRTGRRRRGPRGRRRRDRATGGPRGRRSASARGVAGWSGDGLADLAARRSERDATISLDDLRRRDTDGGGTGGRRDSERREMFSRRRPRASARSARRDAVTAQGTVGPEALRSRLRLSARRGGERPHERRRRRLRPGLGLPRTASSIARRPRCRRRRRRRDARPPRPAPASRCRSRRRREAGRTPALHARDELRQPLRELRAGPGDARPRDDVDEAARQRGRPSRTRSSAARWARGGRSGSSRVASGGSRRTPAPPPAGGR